MCHCTNNSSCECSKVHHSKSHYDNSHMNSWNSQWKHQKKKKKLFTARNNCTNKVEDPSCEEVRKLAYWFAVIVKFRKIFRINAVNFVSFSTKHQFWLFHHQNLSSFLFKNCHGCCFITNYHHRLLYKICHETTKIFWVNIYKITSHSFLSREPLLLFFHQQYFTQLKSY